MMNNAGAAPNNTFVGGPLISPRGKRLLPPQAPASSMTTSSATIGSPAGPMTSLFSLHTLQAHLLRSPLSANASPAGSPLMPPNNSSTTTTTPSIPSGGASATSFSVGEQNKRRLPSVQAPASSPLPKKARLSEKSAKQPRKSSKQNGTVQLLHSLSCYFFFRECV